MGKIQFLSGSVHKDGEHSAMMFMSRGGVKGPYLPGCASVHPAIALTGAPAFC